MNREHGSVTRAWQQMGQPDPPTREQTATLRSAASAVLKETLKVDANGELLVQRTLDPWSIVLVEEV